VTSNARRVAVTGIGILSCLGNTCETVSSALRTGYCGIEAMPQWHARGMGSQIAARVRLDGMTPFARRYERFMGDTARFACHAARLALIDAGLDAQALCSPRAGAVIGSGSGALQAYDDAMALVGTRGVERASPFIVPQVMGNTACASVAQVFGIEGITYAVSAACTTSAIALGQAAELIACGAQDVMLAGGSEALHDNTALMFDAMGVLSLGFNAAPHTASRPYDSARDGFVIGEGAGVLVLESLTHAQARGARVLALLDGYGHSTDPGGFVSPGAAGIARAIGTAWAATDHALLDYINTHAPSTPQGDLAEAEALRRVFGSAQRSYAGSLRCTRGDLYVADDARRFYRRQHGATDVRRGPAVRSGVRRSATGHADPCRTHRAGHVGIVRFWRQLCRPVFYARRD